MSNTVDTEEEEEEVPISTIEEFNEGLITNPTIPESAVFEPTTQTPNEEELMEGVSVDPEGVNAGPASTANTPVKTDANTFDASQVDENVAGSAATAEQGTVSQDAQVDAAQGTLSGDTLQAIDDAATSLDDFELDKRATVQEQYKNLMDFEPDEIPPWAKGAYRKAMQTVSARGALSSTNTAEAITTALMEAGLPIAVQDARIYGQVELSKMDSRKQAALFKASALANMDMTNLNNRQQANVANAQAFLQMDLSNLTNRQQAAIFNAQSRIQAMFSNQAAENAAEQFNAASQNQIDTFFANLQSQVETFNAAQQNKQGQFNATMEDAREQFNAKNAILIEQSNTQYLREINTRNTELINQGNLINSQNLLNISNTALANAFTLLRDREAYAFEMSESKRERDLRRALAVMQQNHNMELVEREEDFAVGTAISGFAANILTNVFDSAFS